MSSDAAASPTVSSAARRYAEALFDLALEAGALDQVEGDLSALSAMVAGSPDFRAFVASPVYDAHDKSRAIAAIGAGADLSALVRNFLGVVARNRRLFALAGMIEAFRRRLAEHRGEVSAEAVAAAPLNEDQMRRLRGEIERVVGKAVNLSVRTDPSLLGGMVVRVGSKMIDSSLKTKLNRLKSVMKEA
jgi:F-type H+-transporting ATPase subunit delta